MYSINVGCSAAIGIGLHKAIESLPIFCLLYGVGLQYPLDISSQMPHFLTSTNCILLFSDDCIYHPPLFIYDNLLFLVLFLVELSQ